MPIEFTCDACGKLLRTADERAGARAVCPECQQLITVPIPDAVSSSRLDETAAWVSPAIDNNSASADARIAPPLPLASSSQAPWGFCAGCGKGLVEPASYCPSCGAASGAGRTSSPSKTPATYAGFWRRFAAMLLDLLILGAAQGVIESLPGFLRTGGAPELLIWWLYHALLESSEYQATIGKLALGLIVTDEQGRRLSFGRATGRTFAKILSIIPIFLGYLMAAFSPRKQALHDLIAGCLVLRKS